MTDMVEVRSRVIQGLTQALGDDDIALQVCRCAGVHLCSNTSGRSGVGFGSAGLNVEWEDPGP